MATPTNATHRAWDMIAQRREAAFMDVVHLVQRVDEPMQRQ
jgi:hypothetical protein